MSEPRNKFRVLVDWDNDGFHNVGVPVGTPPNIVPFSVYSNVWLPFSYTLAAIPATSFFQVTSRTPAPIFYEPTEWGLTSFKPTNFGTRRPFGDGIEREDGDYDDGNFRIGDCVHLKYKDVAYTLIFYIKNANSLDIHYVTSTLGGATYDLTPIVTSISASADYQRVRIEIPAESTTKGWWVEFVGTVADDDRITGIQLYEGDVDCVHNTGALSGYDDISSYVLSASWELGRNQFDDPLAYEGTARIKLNNDTKIFSPNNEDSPLFGQAKQNLLIKLQYETAINTWETLWTGWTSQFKTIAGRNSTRQAEIVCSQGIYRLRDGVLDFDLTETLTVNEAILEIIRNAGYRSPYYPLMTSLNMDYHLGWNTFLQDPELLFSHLSTLSGRHISGVGANWGRKTTPSEAITDILTAEHSKLWIDREGGLVLKHREDFVNNEADYELDMGTEVQEAIYTFGEDVINRVEVIVKPRSTVSNEVIWSTKNAIFIQGHPFGDGNLAKYTRYVQMQFEFEEGKQRTILDIDGKNISQMNAQIYTRDPLKYADPSRYLIPQGTWNGQVWATVLGGDSLRKLLQVRNNLPNDVYIMLEVTGDYLEGGEGGVYIVEDLASQEALNAVQSMTIELPSATTEVEATSYGNYILHEKSTPYGEFTSMTIKNDPTIKLGDIVSLSEEQTTEQNKLHVILGEAGDYGAGGVLELVYAMARLDEQRYTTTDDDEILYGLPNPIENMLDALVFSGEFSEQIALITPESEAAYILRSGSGNVVFIGNTDGQYINRFKARVDYTTTPDTINFYEDYGSTLARGYIKTNADQELQDYDYSYIAETMYIPIGTSLWFGVRTGTGTSRIELRRVSDNTLLANSATSSSFSPQEITHAESTDVKAILDIVSAGTTTFSSLAVLNYLTLPTTDLDLEAGIVHHLMLWTASETAGTVTVKVIAEDGTKILDSTLSIGVGFARHYIDFTPVAGKEHAHAIILHTATMSELNIYGIGVSPTLYDTYTEMNTRINSLPVMYI